MVCLCKIVNKPNKIAVIVVLQWERENKLSLSVFATKYLCKRWSIIAIWKLRNLLYHLNLRYVLLFKNIFFLLFPTKNVIFKGMITSDKSLNMFIIQTLLAWHAPTYVVGSRYFFLGTLCTKISMKLVCVGFACLSISHFVEKKKRLDESYLIFSKSMYYYFYISGISISILKS